MGLAGLRSFTGLVSLINSLFEYPKRNENQLKYKYALEFLMKMPKRDFIHNIWENFLLIPFA